MPLDMLGCRAGYDASLMVNGKRLDLDHHGNKITSFDRFRAIKGSWSDQVVAKRVEPSEAMMKAGVDHAGLWFRGNPVKYLQGQNIWAPCLSNEDWLRAAVSRMRQHDEDFAKQVPDLVGTVLLWEPTELHFAVMVEMESHQAVHDYLTACGYTRSRIGPALVEGVGNFGAESVVWHRKLGKRGKTVKRGLWEIIAYCKYCESAVKGHAIDPLLGTSLFREELRESCKCFLRIELRLYGELKREDIGLLNDELVWYYWNQLILGHLNESSNDESSNDELKGGLIMGTDDLDYKAKRTFDRWWDEKDVKKELPRSTFYYHRQKILDATKCDILLPAKGQGLMRAYTGPRVDRSRVRTGADQSQAIQDTFYKVHREAVQQPLPERHPDQLPLAV
jgi:hypothetical protein